MLAETASHDGYACRARACRDVGRRGAPFQPRVELLSDIRVESESGFVFKLTKVLATSITLTAHYDSNPLPGVLRTDTELENTLTLAL
jgi:hypothetical protein